MTGSRYRIISTRMWADARFRALSPAQPSGQSLWIYLLCGPHTGPIPGLFSATAEDLAARLRWPIEAFREAFAEVIGQGMAEASWKDDLVWLPNALAHNMPQSPNVVRSWRSALQELPECELRDRAMRHIGEVLSAHGDSFFLAWQECIEGIAPAPAKPTAKPSAKPSRKTCPNQEQEQEQEQEKKGKGDKTPPTPPSDGPPPSASDGGEPPGEGVEGEGGEGQARAGESVGDGLDDPATDDGALPPWIPAAPWTEFVAMRKAKRAPLTPGAIRLTVKQLAKFRDEFGHAPAAVLEQSVQRGWVGVFPLKPDFAAAGSRPAAAGHPALSKVGQASVSAAQRWLERTTQPSMAGEQRDDRR